MARVERERGRYAANRPKAAGQNNQTVVEFARSVMDANEQAHAALVVIPVGKGTEEQVEQLGVFQKEEYAGRKSVSFLVAGIPGTPMYDVVDLNNLPPSVSVEIKIEMPNGTSVTRWAGESGAQLQSSTQVERTWTHDPECPVSLAPCACNDLNEMVPPDGAVPVDSEEAPGYSEEAPGYSEDRAKGEPDPEEKF